MHASLVRREAPLVDRPSHPARSKKPLPIATVSAGMLTCEVCVDAADVVFVKGVLEASDGLAAVFAERGGDLTLVAPRGREVELSELLTDLSRELHARVGAIVDRDACAAVGVQSPENVR